ncbi:MAG: ATP synthase F0 subunit C [Elusimicrobiota bacterium]|nr:ATP synthase F0 subunit C [Elusimicrobiota bacterium]
MLYLGIGYLGAAVGAGLVLVGAGLGIGKLAASAMEGTARQPEAGGAIRTSMIIAAALIEGLGFFALVICLLVAMNFSGPAQPEAGHDAVQVEAHK